MLSDSEVIEVGFDVIVDLRGVINILGGVGVNLIEMLISLIYIVCGVKQNY